MEFTPTQEKEMLILGRRPGEKVRITTPGGEVIDVIVIDRLSGGNVRLGFEAAKDIRIDRLEAVSHEPRDPIFVWADRNRQHWEHADIMSINLPPEVRAKLEAVFITRVGLMIETIRKFIPAAIEEALHLTPADLATIHAAVIAFWKRIAGKAVSA
jgi:sRNA-binding carbon storage regulator CsrA